MKKTWPYGTLTSLSIAVASLLPGCSHAENASSSPQASELATKSKTLIVYYTYTQHTRLIAERIQKAKGCDMVLLELVEAYPDDYSTLEALAKRHAEEKFAPEIKALPVDVSQYDTIILGTPVWWYTFAPAVRSFLKNHDLSGKTIVPYSTHAGWPGHTFEDIKALCPHSKVIDELAIQFSTVAEEKRIVSSEVELEKWILRH